MHKSNFVAVIKCNGEVLRERDRDSVLLPFGSEYSIRLKNLEKRRASVRIFIDGRNIFGENGSYILDGRTEREIERFVGDNLNSGNRFKFIKKTSEISQYRGDRVDDGLVCVEFTFEKQCAVQEYVSHNTYIHADPPLCDRRCWKCRRHYCPVSFPWTPWYTTSCSSLGWNSVTNMNDAKEAVFSASALDSGPVAYNMSSNVASSGYAQTVSNSPVSSPTPNEGITVKGSVSDQKFSHAFIGELESVSHTITLQLKGYWPKKVEVKKPVTTHEKLVCPTCGLSSGTDATYCKRCGTYLIG